MNLRKTNLLVLLMIFFQLANAQTESVSKPLIVGGAFNIVGQKNSYYYYSFYPESIFADIPSGSDFLGFDFIPYAAKEINPNWQLGCQLNYRLSILYDDARLIRRNQFELGMFARYLLFPEKTFHPFLQPYAGYLMLFNDKVRDGKLYSRYRVKAFNVEIRLGALYKIHPKWNAVLSLGGLRYLNGESWDTDDTYRHKFSAFSINSTLSGMRIGIERKF